MHRNAPIRAYSLRWKGLHYRLRVRFHVLPRRHPMDALPQPAPADLPARGGAAPAIAPSRIETVKGAEDAAVPLCVDMDGTLINTDVLWESIIRLVKRNPAYALMLPIWLAKGRAHL